MPLTPLGNIKVYVKEVEFTTIKLGNLYFPSLDIKGRYLIQYEYKNEF